MSDNKENLKFTGKVFLICLVFCTVILLLCLGMYKYEKREDKSVFNYVKDVYTVIIDAGHGGRDGGAISESGLVEKELNLEISKRIEDILKLCGINTVMTRTDDKLVCDEDDPALKGRIKMTDLANRLKIAECESPDMFISVHMNKFPVEKYKGFQVYYSKNHAESFELARLLQESVTEILQPDNTRKVKPAGSNIYILDRITSPAVLVECGFLSNEEEAYRLANPIYRSQLSLVISDCILTKLFISGNN